jgi:alkylation response protein AidB-like acyl-CoA dehydrogenase
MKPRLILRYHIGRHVANLQVANTYEGTHDIHGMPNSSRMDD